MSDSGDAPNAPTKPPPLANPPPRHGCLTALMVVVGIALLLPGICTLVLSRGNFGDPLMAGIAGITLLVFIGGVALIALALRNQR